jgi:membrane-associated phospholipid phosphatase
MKVRQPIVSIGSLEREDLERSKEIARWISNVLSPPVFGLVGFLLLFAGNGSWRGVEWLLFYLLVAFGVPIVYLLHLLRIGAVTDFHLKVRAQRIRPMLVMMGSSLLAAVIMQFGAAPTVLKMVALAGTLLLAIMLIITLSWKISGHSTAVSAFAVLVLGFFGLPALPVLILIPTVIWARLHLGRHSLGQTLGGAALGCGFMGMVLTGILLQCQEISFVCG